jgi:hypothetical protein
LKWVNYPQIKRKKKNKSDTLIRGTLSMRGSRKNIIREIYLKNAAAKASLRGISLRALSYQLSEYRLAGRNLPAFYFSKI